MQSFFNGRIVPAMRLGNKIKVVLMGAFLIMGLAAATQAGASALLHKGDRERSLSMYNTHTNEYLDVTYWKNGRYDAAAMKEISIYLRDHRSGTHIDMSRDVINYLHEIKLGLQARYPNKQIRFDIISGYRSPETNAMLRARGGGQAKKSRHMFGDAIDIRVPGVDSAVVRDVAWCLQRGGVGYYKSSNFVHVDTGDIRHWHWAPNANTCGNDNAPAS